MKDLRPVSIYPYLDIVYRHRRSALSVLAMGLFTTVFLLLMLPDVYRSTAVIAIEPAQVGANYINLEPNSNLDTSNVSDQLSALARQAFNKERLIQLIKRFGLYNYHPGGSIDKILVLMERHIEMIVPQDAITYESSRSQTGAPDVLRISFEYRDRMIAQKVTAALADSYMEEGYRERIQQAVDASRFLSTQVAEERKQLDAKGNEIKELEQRYQGSLPEELAANLGEVARLDNQLSMVNSQMDVAHSPAIAGGSGPAQSPEQEIKRLQIELSQLRAQYSDQYPDVVELRQQIAQLKQQIKESPATGEESPDSAASRLQRQAVALQGQIEVIKARVAATPVHGQELAALKRDYDALTTEYQGLLSKLLAAQLRENLEKRHQEGSLRLLEAANFPQKPIRPNRPAVFIVGLMFTLTAALALPFGLYFTDTSYKDVDELSKEFGIPVAGVIPSIQNRAQQRLVTLRMAVASSAGIMISAAAIWAYANNLF